MQDSNSSWKENEGTSVILEQSSVTMCAWCLCPSSGWFKHIKPLRYRDSKMWRVLTHEFGVVRPYRNFLSTSLTLGSLKGAIWPRISVNIPGLICLTMIHIRMY